jgi:hypothetical protein
VGVLAKLVRDLYLDHQSMELESPKPLSDCTDDAGVDFADGDVVMTSSESPSSRCFAERFERLRLVVEARAVEHLRVEEDRAGTGIDMSQTAAGRRRLVTSCL